MKQDAHIKLNFRNSKDVLNKKIKNSAFKKAYDNLDLEFVILGALIEARAKRGMTQENLAQKIGTKQSSIARFESGRSNPTFAFAQKLFNALDLKITVTPRHAKH